MEKISAKHITHILLYETKAVINILEKNVYRRYRYSEELLCSLINIVNRNLDFVYQIITERINSQQIIYNLIPDQNKHYRKNMNSVESISVEDLSKIIKVFYAAILSAFSKIIYMFKLYGLDFNINIALHFGYFLKPLNIKVVFYIFGRVKRYYYFKSNSSYSRQNYYIKLANFNNQKNSLISHWKLMQKLSNSSIKKFRLIRQIKERK
eukprot:GHVR01137108.1.p1 GENE.GHVR01137108.1~~GHVR01137108.1.p1  ORF type:complete len:209 (-),score=-5.30 GHVR01137108.1:644-1270(-)